MPTPDAEYLKSEGLFAVAEVAGALAKWGDLAASSSLMSPLVNTVDANDEAAAQAAFMAGPLARDLVIVKGRRSDLFLRAVTITGDRLGYEAGDAVFVLDAREQDNGTTILKVLKRLAP